MLSESIQLQLQDGQHQYQKVGKPYRRKRGPRCNKAQREANYALQYKPAQSQLAPLSAQLTQARDFNPNYSSYQNVNESSTLKGQGYSYEFRQKTQISATARSQQPTREHQPNRLIAQNQSVEKLQRINSWGGEVHAMVLAVIADEESNNSQCLNNSSSGFRQDQRDYKGFRSWNSLVENEVAYYLEQEDAYFASTTED